VTCSANADAAAKAPEPVTFEMISRAELRIQDGIVQTPCIPSPLFR
jgi:hypothetical protein